MRKHFWIWFPVHTGADVKMGRRFRRPKSEEPCLVVLAVGFVAGPALTAAVEPAAIFPVYSDLFTVIVEIAC